jgi:hypothetical protein
MEICNLCQRQMRLDESHFIDGTGIICERCWSKPDKLEPGACPRAYAAARQLVKAGLISTSLPMGPDELLDVLARQLEPFTLNREAMPDRGPCGCEIHEVCEQCNPTAYARELARRELAAETQVDGCEVGPYSDMLPDGTRVYHDKP